MRCEPAANPWQTRLTVIGRQKAMRPAVLDVTELDVTELDDVTAVDQVHPMQLGSDIASGSPHVHTTQPQSRFSWLDFRPGGVLTINDKDATASCIFFWLYVMAFVVGLVCLFVGCGWLFVFNSRLRCVSSLSIYMFSN